MTCYGGTADLAIMRELFKNTIAAAEVLGIDADFSNKLEETTASWKNCWMI